MFGVHVCSPIQTCASRELEKSCTGLRESYTESNSEDGKRKVVDILLVDWSNLWV